MSTLFLLPSPVTVLASLWRQRELIRQLALREALGRYRGSYLGVLWSFITPLILLSVFTFVFAVVFQSRWSGQSGGATHFALILFPGLIVFNIFSESVSRAPTLILANANYVKRVVFPLEILPIVALASSLVHAAINLAILLPALAIGFAGIPLTALMFPLVLVPLVLFTLGFSWFLAATGVYIRDIGQVVSLFVTALLFLSPIFYPVNAVAAEVRFFYHLNPMSYVVEETRRLLIWGQPLDAQAFAFGTALSALVAWLGYAWFQKTRKGFADVL